MKTLHESVNVQLTAALKGTGKNARLEVNAAVLFPTALTQSSAHAGACTLLRALPCFKPASRMLPGVRLIRKGVRAIIAARVCNDRGFVNRMIYQEINRAIATVTSPGFVAMHASASKLLAPLIASGAIQVKANEQEPVKSSVCIYADNKRLWGGPVDWSDAALAGKQTFARWRATEAAKALFQQ